METKTRVLLYTASKEFSDICSQVLQKSRGSFALSCAHNRQVFGRLASASPHIVLLDDSVDAEDAMETIHRLQPELPAIFLGERPGSNSKSRGNTSQQTDLPKSQLALLAPLIAGLTGNQGPCTPPEASRAELFEAVTKVIADSIAVLDTQGQILFWNPAAEGLFGYSSTEVCGLNFREIFDPVQFDKDLAAYFDASEESGEERVAGKTLELSARRKNGIEFPLELSLYRLWHDGQWKISALMRDITERCLNLAKLDRLTSYDPLTGLPNRTLLRDRMSQAMIRSRRNDTVAAVLLVDLDHFNVVNESLGHEAGDDLLKAVAERLLRSIRAGDTIARHAGDEFAVVLSDLRGEPDCTKILKKLINAIERPFHLGEQELYVSASIGAALYPRDGEEGDQLLKNAESAMYSAKESGRKRFEYFTQGMNLHVMERLALENDLRRALNEGQLLLYYQPKVEMRGGRIKGVEALIRWQHPERGLLMPAEFLPAAEESGLMVGIGGWVLRTACAQCRAWRDRGFDIVVSVNISISQLRDHRFVDQVRTTLSETGLPPSLLELELNESILLSHSKAVGGVLEDLKKLGVQHSVDDFWMGYSSVREFKRFPIDKVKIDRSFISDIIESPEAASIVGAVISMAHHLNLKVIAEGVETREQQEFLRLRRCDEFQGFLFSKPLPADELDQCLEQGTIPQVTASENQPERTLLLVDSEENILRALTRLLRQDGYQILKTTSPADALRMMASNSVGVIVSDQRMPEMSGVEFFRQLKRWYPDTVRMVLSGYTELKSVTDAINEGAVYKFITKPWDDDQLRSTIQEAFERYELKRNYDLLLAQLADTNEQLLRTQQALEIKVREQTGISQRNLDVLNVSREVLEYLPVGVVGVDEDDLVVLANQRASELLGPGIIGFTAEERLPKELNDILRRCEQDKVAALHCNWDTPAGVRAECWCHALGRASAGRGTILVLAEYLMND